MPFIYNWSNGNATEDLTEVASGDYNLTITDNNGCITAGNYSVSTQIPLENPICIVTVDSLTNRNKIVWEKIQDSGIDHYNIYKESTMAGVFQYLASIPFADLSEYIDINANPNIRSWRYKLSAVDNCGNESPLSEVHKTIHLTINEGLNGQWNLIWDDYEGFPYYSFDLFRYNNSNGWEHIQTMPANLHSYTDTPSQGLLFYKVEASKGDSCLSQSADKTQGGPYSHSSSNIDETLIDVYSMRNAALVNVRLYPNPVNDKLIIEQDAGIYNEFMIMNISGKSLLLGKISSNKTQIDVNSIPAAVYFIKLKSENGFMFSKFVKM
jgi:L-rhamnose mutarotase